MSVSFEKDCQGQSSYKAIIDRQDLEIKVLDTFRELLTEKIRHDQHYAKKMELLFCNTEKAISSCKTGTKMSTAWETILKSNKEFTSTIKDRCEKLLNNTLQKFITIINDKKILRKYFIDEKQRLDNIEKDALNEVNSAKKVYKDTLRIWLADKNKFDKECTSREYALPPKEAKMKSVYDKLSNSTLKLNNCHNNYVIALNYLNEIKNCNATITYPSLLKCQQSLMENYIQQWSDIFDDFVVTTNLTDRECQKYYNLMTQAILDVKPKEEYHCFITENKSVPEGIRKIIFDESLNESNKELRADNLKIDTGTVDELNNKIENYSVKKMEHEQKKKSYEAERQELSDKKHKMTPVYKRNDIEATDGYQIDRKIKRLQQQIEEERGFIDMYTNLQKHIQKAVRAIHAKDLETPLKEFDVLLDEEKRTLPLNTSHSTSSKTSLLDLLKNVLRGKKTTSIEANSIEELCDEPCADVSDTIECADYFHGVLPRQEATALLVNDGDFLVRLKEDANGDQQYVLSVCSNNSHKHFVVQVTNKNLYKFDSEEFSSVKQLIDYYKQQRKFITEKTKAIIKTPVLKPDWSINNDDVDVKQKIGSGHFGDVCIGVYKPKKLNVAVKTCKYDVSADQKRKFIQEGKLLSNYHHPKIVKFIGIAASKSPIMIVMEFVEKGALQDYLKNNRKLAVRKLIRMCLDAAEGMHYLSKMGIIHRDLAARNCLVANDETVKISDFGLSRQEDDDGLYASSDGKPKQIPIKWTAPEGLFQGIFTTKSDVWSFGILVWEIFSFGAMPYPRLNMHNKGIGGSLSNTETKEFINNGGRMQPPNNLESVQGFTELLSSCWEFNPEDRPTFQRVELALQMIYKEN